MNMTGSTCRAAVEPHNGTVICLDTILNVQHTVLVPLNVLTIVFNSFTIVTVFISRKLHTIPNMLIVSLAISDFLEGILSLCTNFMYLAFDIPCSRNCENDFVNVEPSWVRDIRFVISLSFTCNYFCLLIIAIQQWLYIFQPFLHDRLVRPRSTILAITICFVVSVLINLDILLVKSNMVSQNETFGRRMFAAPALHSAASGLMFAVYFHITLIAYQQLRSLRRQVACICGDPNVDQPQSLKVLSSIRFLKMFFMSFGVFFVCLSPLIFYRVFLGQAPRGVQEWTVIVCLETLPAIHYLANFFVFAIQHKELNSELRKLPRKCLRLWKY